MLRRVFSRFSLALFFLLCATLTAQAAPTLRYEIGMTQPTTHLFTVEMSASGLPATSKTVEFAQPVWTPGSYLVREFSRNVQDFQPMGTDGKTLPWEKTRKNVWRVTTNGASSVTVRYRVYANALAVQQAELTDTGAFWNNAALLMYLRGNTKTPATVVVNPLTGWSIATGLRPATNLAPNTFTAADIDTLYDSPFLCGPLDTAQFTLEGKSHRIAILGSGNYDKAQFAGDVRRIVEAESKTMGGLPYDDYTFLFILRDGGGGGLEHLNSTAIILPPYGFRTPAGYRGALSVVAHEFFHLWNVKRIKPDALGPFDYENENYTRLLWVAEGLTAYYEDVFLLRAGLYTPEAFLASMTGTLGSVEETPGRKVLSLEEASFDAWIKQYRPDENSGNSQINYYSKGSLVGMLLDLTIRQKTDNARSLDDVLRTLYRDYAQKGRNYTPSEFQKVCEQIAGTSLDGFFSDYVRGTKELDYAPLLETVGLTLTRTARTNSGEEVAPTAYFGARFVATTTTTSTNPVTAPDPGGAKVSGVPTDSPAYAQGISAGDTIVAVNGVRVRSGQDVNDRLADRKPGDKVTFTLFRLDKLRTIEVTLGSRVRSEYRLSPLPNATPAQRTALRTWLTGG